MIVSEKKKVQLSFPDSLGLSELVLENGFQLLLCPLNHLHRVSVCLSIGAGSRDEEAVGAAHLLEHLIFRGSSRYPSLQALTVAFEALGVDFNAYTSRESTVFDLSLPPDSLEESLILLAEVIRFPRLCGIAAEREIIREEILSDYDEEKVLINADDLMMESFFEGGLGRVIAGSPEEVGTLSRSDVVKFYRDFYCGQRMVLSVVGKVFSSESVISLVSSLFSVIPARGKGVLESCSGLRGGSKELWLRSFDGSSQTEISYGVLGPSLCDSRYSVMETLVRILDDGMSSRLSRRLVEELALVYDTECMIIAARELSLLHVRMSCRHRRVSRLLDAMFGVFSEIYEKGIPDEEMERVQRRVLWEYAALLDSPASLSHWLCSSKQLGLVCDLQFRCEDMLRVDGREVSKFAGECLSEAVQRIVLIGELSKNLGSKLSEGYGFGFHWS